ncbi:MAG: hypothetical protein ACK56F_28895, partial [bacterium]
AAAVHLREVQREAYGGDLGARRHHRRDIKVEETTAREVLVGLASEEVAACAVREAAIARLIERGVACCVQRHQFGVCRSGGAQSDDSDRRGDRAQQVDSCGSHSQSRVSRASAGRLPYSADDASRDEATCENSRSPRPIRTRSRRSRPCSGR